MLIFRVKPQQSSQPDYIPAPEVINQNHAFEYALSSAPNVLYARYKQYGQVRKMCCAVRLVLDILSSSVFWVGVPSLVN